MKHTKDGKNLNALLRRAMLGVLDIMLFALANCSICYLTMNGHIMATDYKYMIFNYLHFGLTSVLLVVINSAFGLYRSVWYFAGSDEIVKSFLGALVNAVQLFLCDRLLFAKLLHTKGYLPYYAYILFFVLMFVATLIPRIGYRILRRYVHNLVGRRDGQKRIMIVGAGFMGNFIIDELRNDHYREGRPVIALDDNPAKYKKRINGVKIVGICDDLPRLTEKYKIDEIIFCIPSAAPARRRDLVNLAMGTKANVKISPSVQEFWENGNGAQRIRNVEISDLLSRPERPQIVFHAAAHKHVPLMETSPCEAVKNNVFGTYNVAVAADKFKVPKMVILSTDKAVNPTNVMGATKRLTEIIIQYMNTVSQNTRYAAVRFGNVLGSHGSVIPIFQHQIAQGGPVCVTHKDITRYFMTIPEAAQLVCQAGGLALGGEVFVLDMGEPVKIMDLAKNLIRLSGFTEEEIPIKITGLRPGEKLYEELAMEEEMQNRQRTANKKIFVTQPVEIDKDRFAAMLEDLANITPETVRTVLMRYVPNYHPAPPEQGNTHKGN